MELKLAFFITFTLQDTLSWGISVILFSVTFLLEGGKKA